MSLSAALVLAAAAASAAAQGEPPRGGAVAQARATATILPAVTVRQANGEVRANGPAPEHRVSRRGNRVLIEFQ